MTPATMRLTLSSPLVDFALKRNSAARNVTSATASESRSRSLRNSRLYLKE
jgi:hypothetical protein